MAINVTYSLWLGDAEATAQQVYDAFMDGIVRIDKGDGNVISPTSIYWENSDGTQTDPAAVTYVETFDNNGTLAKNGTMYNPG